jgi:hypothetical protein
MSWIESVSCRCRGAEAFNETLLKASVIWEDSLVGPSGHVFCIGMNFDEFFVIQYEYDTYEKQTNLIAGITVFDDTQKFKIWLRDLKSKNHPKMKEIFPIMKFFLT